MSAIEEVLKEERRLNEGLQYYDYPMCGETSVEMDERIHNTAAEARRVRDLAEYLVVIQNIIDFLKDDNVVQDYRSLCLDADQKRHALGLEPIPHDDFCALAEFIRTKKAPTNVDFFFV